MREDAEFQTRFYRLIHEVSPEEGLASGKAATSGPRAFAGMLYEMKSSASVWAERIASAVSSE